MNDLRIIDPPSLILIYLGYSLDVEEGATILTAARLTRSDLVIFFAN